MHCTATRKQCQPQALEHRSPGGPQGTRAWKQTWCMCERAGAPFKPFLHTKSGHREESTSRPWKSLRRPEPTPSVVLHAVLAASTLGYRALHPAIHLNTPQFVQPSTRRAVILVSGMLFSLHFHFCSVSHWIWRFPFASNRCMPLWAVLYSCSNYLSLWRIHFSLYSRPVQSPLSSILFPKMHHLPSASSSDLFL